MREHEKVLAGIIVFMVLFIGGALWMKSIEKCLEYGTVKSFVQAVGDRYRTRYVYLLEDGSFYDSENSQVKGETVCKQFGYSQVGESGQLK